VKILVVGNTQGKLHKINEYIKKSGADFVLCTGDFGILYKNENKLPKFIKDNQFYKYLYGEEKFIVPVYAVRGPHDNLSFIRQIYDHSLQINNFTLIKDGETIELKKNEESIIVGGLGGSYSYKYYNHTKLFGYEKRHFNITMVNQLKKANINILLLYDIIDNHKKNSVHFSSEMFSLLRTVRPYYTIVGKYNWWGAVKIFPTSNFITIPSIDNGYLIIDTKDWRAEAVRLDLNIGGKN